MLTTYSTNKKVKNATPTEEDGIKFRSKLELYTYKALKEAGIEVRYEQDRFELVPKFEYDDEKVRPMTYKPDFTHDLFIIECKGFANDAFPLRWKLFKYVLFMQGVKKKLYLVKNQKQVKEAIADIIERFPEIVQQTNFINGRDFN